MAKKQKRTNSIRRGQKNRRIAVVCVALFLVIVLGIQLGRLYTKKQKYESEQAAYEKLLEEQEARQKELQDYETYTQSSEYAENEAQSKLGMVHENEIIFREK